MAHVLPDDFRLHDVLRNGRILPDHDVPLHPLRADDSDVRDEVAAARSKGGREESQRVGAAARQSACRLIAAPAVWGLVDSRQWIVGSNYPLPTIHCH